MEKAERTEKREKWYKHATESAKYPGGISKYCRDHGLHKKTISYWRRKFGFTKKSIRAGRARSNAFIPVEVINIEKKRQLPDPKWVAEFLMHLLQEGAGR